MNFAEAYKADLHQAIDLIDTGKVHQAIEWFREARDNGATIFTCAMGQCVHGIGISAATS